MPESVPPPAFVIEICAVVVLPCCTERVAEFAETAMLGGAAVMLAVPLCPSLVAVIVTVPELTPVTRPLAATVATLGSEVFQAMLRPERVFPWASASVAESCCVFPGPVIPTVAVAGDTVTFATGASTVTVIVFSAYGLLIALGALIVV